MRTKNWQDLLLRYRWNEGAEEWEMQIAWRPAAWLRPWQWESAIAAENRARELREAASLHGREGACEADAYEIGYDLAGRLTCRAVDASE